MRKSTLDPKSPFDWGRLYSFFWSIANLKLISYWKIAQRTINNRRYRRWIKLNEARRNHRKTSGELKVSILIAVYNTDPVLLHKSIKSAQLQTYKNIEICIADDGSTRSETLAVIEGSRSDPRVKVVIRSRNGHISEATNTAFALSTGAWTTILDHDDMLHPSAIEELVNAVSDNPNAQVIYSDEDKIDEYDRRFSPFFKPDFSSELLSSQNYFNHLTAYRSDAIRGVGGWRRGFEGSQDFDLNLRIIEHINPMNIVHIPKILYHWRAVKGSTALCGDEKSYAQQAAERALEDHVSRLGISSKVEPVSGTKYHRLHHLLPKPPPLVTIITEYNENGEGGRARIEALVQRTEYRPLEIVVVKNQGEVPSSDWVGQNSSDDISIRAVVAGKVGNPAAAWNSAVVQSRGEIICILAENILPSQPDWLDDMVAMALGDGVGCVGPKILYPGNTVHSAGVVIGAGGTVGYAHAHYSGWSSGYYSRLRLPHNVSAVSSLCMAVRKEAFVKGGGFSEQLSIGILNDVDFCLRLKNEKLRHVIVPSCEVVFRFSVNRDAVRGPHQNASFDFEYQILLAKWGRALQHDPFYSPNHRLESADFLLAI